MGLRAKYFVWIQLEGPSFQAARTLLSHAQRVGISLGTKPRNRSNACIRHLGILLAPYGLQLGLVLMGRITAKA